MFPDYQYSKNLFKKYNLELSEDAYNKFAVYADFLVEYNQNVNLTAITDGEEILVKHFLDSVLVCRYCDIPQNSSVIDVGTGAGFPSVPLKIFRPDIKITLLDSLNKRITFLQLLCQKLEIQADFIHGRAEDSGKNPLYREKFDVACARAVANLSVLSEFCLPFVRKDGIFISMKGFSENIENARNSVEMLGGSLETPVDYSLENEGRRIVRVIKISHTPTKFPRNSGQIKKKPL
ncbi:MAG: 16S rRNA (guanine(527)-N(7))-methyltransferase RsmG [Ruminococcus sp.]|nr:16S rRNA (guanine(527)-N(7))-methyltransferase RsmG [Oscillospiraceae bacterium]MDY4414780.1 16S rRNA (guanine(527)-N(7))-methyltransferase RsmG [Ruminococcus sp.]